MMDTGIDWMMRLRSGGFCVLMIFSVFFLFLVLGLCTCTCAYRRYVWMNVDAEADESLR